MSQEDEGALTDGAFVKPLSSHSLTSAGVSMDVLLACWMNGSLMMLTTKPFVALMFAAVSFSGWSGLLRFVTDTETRGGLCVT